MHIFLYGTLRDAQLLSIVAGLVPSEEVALGDHWVARHVDAPLPMICARAGMVARGDLHRDVSDEALARLDAYELPFDYMRQEVTVRDARGQEVAAMSYFPSVTIAASQMPWDIDEWRADRHAVSLRVAQEFARQNPMLDHDALRRAWPMMERRACDHVRAERRDFPATLRHAGKRDEFEICGAPQLSGSFFRLASLDIRHRTFAGGLSPTLAREVMIGPDAALVLPYDPRRDRVLFVEQFRMGPMVHGSPNPWTLEPVAGMVDAFETPADAAHRETVEEAGVELLSLEPMFAGYASPGNATDYFHAYLGVADLPDSLARVGGLASEHEDLRLHLVTFDQAMDLMDSGEITAIPLISMLLWLARHRSRIKAA